jgi:hypothetical protein
MSRGPNRIRESEVERVTRAARKAGAKAVVVYPSTGKIIIYLDDKSTGGADGASADANPWDEIYEKDKDRPA